jgi:hypothetical protein
MEILGARSTFARLGAAPDERRAAKRLTALEDEGSAGTRAVRTFMFTYIVAAKSWRARKRSTASVT